MRFIGQSAQRTEAYVGIWESLTAVVIVGVTGVNVALFIFLRARRRSRLDIRRIDDVEARLAALEHSQELSNIARRLDVIEQIVVVESHDLSRQIGALARPGMASAAEAEGDGSNRRPQGTRG